VLVLGVAPNGVSKVLIVSGGSGDTGHVTVLPVRRNSYAVTVVDPTAVRVNLRVGTGTVSEVIPVASFEGPWAPVVP
jgi:hypothetical protein